MSSKIKTNVPVKIAIPQSIRQTFKYDYVRTESTNLSPDYVIDWSVWEMLRETVQNMMDEAEFMAEDGAYEQDVVNQFEDWTGQYSFNFQMADFCKTWVKDGHLYLADMGRGVDFNNILLLGQSGKRGHNYRGEKGEGELLSFLVAARLGIEKWMFSKDWAVTGRFTKMEGTELEILVLDYYETSNGGTLDDRKWGTIWKYHYAPGLQKLYDELYDRFPDLSRERIRSEQAENNRAVDKHNKQARLKERMRKQEQRKKGTSSKKIVFMPRKNTPPRLYVKGIYVRDIDNALFSYNLRDNIEINRDRNMVSDMQIFDEIETAFNSSDFNASMADKFWNAGCLTPDQVFVPLELQRFMTIKDSNWLLFQIAFFKVFGKEACVFTEPGYAQDAHNMGFKVVDLHPSARQMAVGIGLPTDESSVHTGVEGTYIQPDKFTKKEVKRLHLLNLLGAKLVARENSTHVVPDLNITDAFLSSWGFRKEALGIYRTGGDEIILLRKVLKGDALQLIITFVHELGHHITDASDRTRQFEQWFTIQMVVLMANPDETLTRIVQKLLET